MYSLPSALARVVLGLTALSAHGSDRAVAPPPERHSYVIIFRQGPITLTNADQDRRQKAIVAWATKHHLAGHALDPRGLESDVRHPGIVAPDGANGAWPIVALIFLEARDIAEAAAIAANHPAKHYNVSTEVRPYVVRKIPTPAKDSSRAE